MTRDHLAARSQAKPDEAAALRIFNKCQVTRLSGFRLHKQNNSLKIQMKPGETDNYSPIQMSLGVVGLLGCRVPVLTALK